MNSETEKLQKQLDELNTKVNQIQTEKDYGQKVMLQTMQIRNMTDSILGNNIYSQQFVV